jgi:rfaE bifunctional protein nucleotidyltransferase chain/domain
MPTVVFCGGCFDLLHAGHISLLQRAAKLGDRLIVGLNVDASVAKLKGSGRPIVRYEQRRECLLALRCVDEVIPIVDDNPCNLLRMLTPDVIVKGPGYVAEQMPEAAVVAGYGGQIVILDGPSISTSQIIASAADAVAL